MLKRLIKKMLGCPIGRPLIVVWREKRGEYSQGQIEFESFLSVGKYKIVRWSSWDTPVSDWK